jgi:glycosyltransferase involved in cell wall biosynthesis
MAWSVEVAGAIRALHRQSPLDLVDVPEFGGEGYVHLLARNDWDRIPTVVHLHGPLVMLAHAIGWPEFDSELYRTGSMMEATSIRLADAVMSSSAESVGWCTREHGLDLSSVPVIHTGVDTARFRPQVTPHERPTVVFAGRVTASKGVFDLLDAALEVARDVEGLRLLFVGRDENGCAERLVARAAEARCPELVEVLGPRGNDDLPAVLQQADVFAAPSHHEGGPGFVYLEAMACGLPVIACSGSGIDEIVQSGRTGVLVPPRDPDALAVALRRLLADHTLRLEIGQRARAVAQSCFDTERCLDRLESFYEEVRR